MIKKYRGAIFQAIELILRRVNHGCVKIKVRVQKTDIP